MEEEIISEEKGRMGEVKAEGITNVKCKEKKRKMRAEEAKCDKSYARSKKKEENKIWERQICEVSGEKKKKREVANGHWYVQWRRKGIHFNGEK